MKVTPISHTINAYSSLSSFHFIHFFPSYYFSQQTYFPFTFLPFIFCYISFLSSLPYLFPSIFLPLLLYTFSNTNTCTTVRRTLPPPLCLCVAGWERCPPNEHWLYSRIHEMTGFTNTFIVICCFVCKCKSVEEKKQGKFDFSVDCVSRRRSHIALLDVCYNVLNRFQRKVE